MIIGTVQDSTLRDRHGGDIMRRMVTYTAEEFANLPLTANRPELVRGVLQVREPVRDSHGFTATEIVVAIRIYLNTHPIGAAFIETGYITERGPDTVRGPDVSFMSFERFKGLSGGFFEIAPDLAVEVLSPSNTRKDIERKVTEYFAMGARLVWVADPERRMVTVHAPEARSYVVPSGEFLDGGDVLPGFRVEVKKLFGYLP